MNNKSDILNTAELGVIECLMTGDRNKLLGKGGGAFSRVIEGLIIAGLLGKTALFILSLFFLLNM